jgi:hypothetical protein
MSTNPVNPFARASPSAFNFSPTPVGTSTVTWKFTCGHTFTQQKNTFFAEEIFATKPPKSSTQKCPECVEIEEDQHKKEREATRAK